MRHLNQDILLATAVTLLPLVGCATTPPDQWPHGACRFHSTADGELLLCRLDPEGLGDDGPFAEASLPAEATMDPPADELDGTVVEPLEPLEPLEPMELSPLSAELHLPSLDRLPMDDRPTVAPPRLVAVCPRTWWSAATGWQCLVDETPTGEPLPPYECVYLACPAQ